MEKRKEKNSLFTILTMAMVASLLIIASGCKSTQKSGSTQAVTMKELQTLPALSSSGRHLTAKLKLNVNFKGSKFSASGNIKIKRDEGLQISINAL